MILRTTITPEIAGELHALQCAAYAVESELINYPHLPPLRERADDLLRSSERWLIFKENGEIGGALAFRITPGSLLVSRLFVAPRHFRRGIASRLLRELERYAEPQDRIVVSTAAANEPALALYAKHSYLVFSRTMTDDGLKLVSLEKQLGL